MILALGARGPGFKSRTSPPFLFKKTLTSIKNSFKKGAVTRIRTWVVAATTQSTNHYTITAVAWTTHSSEKYDKKVIAENIKKISPRRGIEPRSSAWQAEILTTILPRMRHFWGTKFTSWLFAIAYDHITLNIPVLVWSPRSSSVEPG